MPHLAAGLELELQDKNFAFKKGQKSKMNPWLSHRLELAIIHTRVYRSATEPQSSILKVGCRQSDILQGDNEQAS